VFQPHFRAFHPRRLPFHTRENRSKARFSAHQISYRARDPLSKERRFIPLRLDDAIQGHFATCGQP
jgi:hypothetical protein